MQTAISREEAFHRLTDILRCKWTIGILDAITRGVVRPGQIERTLEGLSAKVLNERVRKLERYGLIEKYVYDEVPPHTEYRLTSRGDEMVRLLADLRAFAGRWEA